MKTTLEIPDSVFRRAKSVAAEQGIPLREFVTEAVKDKLAANAKAANKPLLRPPRQIPRTNQLQTVSPRALLPHQPRGYI
jgi:hypothetical protein